MGGRLSVITATVVILSGVILSCLGVATASASSGCVTKHEYRRVERGMSQGRVARIFETEGRLSVSSPPYQTRKYKTCARYASVLVTYKHHHVINKAGFWARVATNYRDRLTDDRPLQIGRNNE